MKLSLIALSLWLVCHDVLAQQESLPQCLSRIVTSASPETTVAELQAQCEELTVEDDDAVDTAAEERLLAETSVATNAFSLLLHRTNYLLPIAYNFKESSYDASKIPDVDSINESSDTREFDPTEFKFQLSFKTLVWNDMFGSQADFYAAYTNTSWWQAYNRDESSPFRETIHQPELFVDLPTNLNLFGWELANIRLSINHNSNGRSGEFSRTWNRAYTEFVFSNENNEIWITPWLTLSDYAGDESIEDYMGKFEIGGKHLFGNHTVSWKARNTFDSNNRGSIELDWSFPIKGRDDVKFFVQYFDGYGESLIDYNEDIRRLGLGFKLGM